jgi:regulatory protein
LTPPRSRRRTPPGELRERHAAVDDVAVVLDAAARFLETRSRSVAEVRRRLTTAGYKASLIDSALADLTRQGYLDDESFARAWVASRDRARPRGERALRAELLLKGVERPVVEAALAERGGDEATDEAGDGRSADEVAARRLIEKHRRALERELDPRRRRQKAYALLARNGFDPEVCRRVAASVDADPGDLEGEDETLR